MELTDVQQEAARLGMTVYVASVRPDGRPHSVPIVMRWVDDRVVGFVANPSVKVANLRANPKVQLHWLVAEATNWDSLIIDGTAEIVDTVEGRRALWDRMGYDLGMFEPGGPEADTHVFISVTPERALLLRKYGTEGRDGWRAP
ncbi:MAG: pyridoxamine 5'-phosphate oxidase family protein [Ilumatobacteraceae bacterium]|jgi:nitroimidazol reductase NimA-like FMN-containing flavoprotein (pyridoxamine 5'-phosphate oxidase superfamily)|nr:pyridoxamine 5'-phosphate oxidase family protein [Ilumatobacteraceae bacterium]